MNDFISRLKINNYPICISRWDKSLLTFNYENVDEAFITMTQLFRSTSVLLIIIL